MVHGLSLGWCKSQIFSSIKNITVQYLFLSFKIKTIISVADTPGVGNTLSHNGLYLC